MQAHPEVELKWALSAAGHDLLAVRLAELLGPPHLLDQENRFFDSADLRLRRAACNVRLRTENGRLLMTCKRRAAAIAGAHHHDEWEAWLDGDAGRRLDAAGAGLADLLPLPEAIRAVLAGAPLLAQGGFANHRQEFHDGAELLCLDRTTLPAGRVDHELEIETPDPAAATARWAARLDGWGIAHQHQPLTKFARFLACRG